MKMKLLKNERGYALLIVLLIVTLMFPAGTFLLHVNMNASRQLQQTEAYNSSIAMAEKGVVFVEAKKAYILESQLPIAIARYGDRQNATGYIYNFLARSLNESLPVEEREFGDQSYSIRYVDATADSEGIVLQVSSFGRTDSDFLISKEINISSNMDLLGIDDEGGNHVGNPDNGGTPLPPQQLPPPRTNFPAAYLVDQQIRDYFSNVVQHAPDTRFLAPIHLSGEMGVDSNYHFIRENETRGGSFRINGLASATAVSNLTIGNRLWTESLTMFDSSVHVQGSANINEYLTLRNSSLTVNNHFRTTNSLRIEAGSLLNVSGESILVSGLVVDGGNLNFSDYVASSNSKEIRNIPSMGMVTFTDLWTNNFNVQNANVTLHGTLRAENRPVVNTSTIHIHRDFSIPDTWALFNFGTTRGSLIVIYGEVVVQNNWNTPIPTPVGHSQIRSTTGALVVGEDTLLQCESHRTELDNVICFVRRESPSRPPVIHPDGDGDGNGNGGSGGPSGPSGPTNPDLVEWDIEREIEYLGIQ